MPGRLHSYTVKMKSWDVFYTTLTTRTYQTRRHHIPRDTSPHNFRVTNWNFEDLGTVVCFDAHENLQMPIHFFIRLFTIFLSHRPQLELSIWKGLSYFLSAIWKSVRRVIHLHFSLNILTSLWCGIVLYANYLFDSVSTVLMLLIFCCLTSWWRTSLAACCLIKFWVIIFDTYFYGNIILRNCLVYSILIYTTMQYFLVITKK
jgi:hypothetical protein